jgi:ketosteroid isomerase-like protein
MPGKAEKDCTKVAEGVIDAFNRSDWNSLRSRVAEDIVYQETGTGRRIQGADAYLELCQGWK